MRFIPGRRWCVLCTPSRQHVYELQHGETALATMNTPHVVVGWLRSVLITKPSLAVAGLALSLMPQETYGVAGSIGLARSPAERE
jgi:hypothetical protein